jgi:predicted nucleic acid-binding protein
MGTPFVLDASVTMSWCFPDEATPYSRGVLASLEKTYAVVPALWPFEVANVLASAERRGRIAKEARNEFLAQLDELFIQIERRPALWLWQQILPLAQAHQLSGYDAAYLELAKREGLPFATLDDDLRRAALAEHIPLVEEA